MTSINGQDIGEKDLGLYQSDSNAPWLPRASDNTPLGPIAQENRAERAREHLTQALRLVFPAETWDDSVEETARRVLGFWTEHAPLREIDFNFTTFPRKAKQMIVVANIEFTSVCAHHLLPFVGKVHVGYLPHKLQAGLSKIPRLVEFWARRPQVQETLTSQILEDLKKRLDTSDVIVVIESRHTCVSARGVRCHNGGMTTSLPSGVFFSASAARDEFYSLLARSN
jgi:GTP cyclohydrolase I